MKMQAENLLDILGQCAPGQGRRLLATKDDIFQDGSFAFVRSTGAAFLGDESIETALLEGLGQMVKMLAADAESTSRHHDALAVRMMTPQHLVTHLQPIARVEEVLRREQRITNLLGDGGRAHRRLAGIVPSHLAAGSSGRLLEQRLG